MKNLQKRKWFFCFFILALLMFFAAPSLTAAAQKVQQKAIDCAYAVEKGKDGKETYKLQGKDCKSYVEQMKPQTKARRASIGTDCAGDCVCTWYDNCGRGGCFVCRGCCSELFALPRMMSIR